LESEVEIYQGGLEEYPKPSIVLANLSIVLWIAVGTVACWFLRPLAAWVYLAAVMIMTVFVMRKLVCTNCYYYGKWCCTGWGRLSALLFSKGSIDRFRRSAGIRIAPLFYALLILVPLIMIIIALAQEYSVPKIVVLVLLLLVSIYSGFLSIKRNCSRCKMKPICPGSAAK